jgi:hypothetical protein
LNLHKKNFRTGVIAVIIASLFCITAVAQAAADGITWTIRSTPTATEVDWRSVTYGTVNGTGLFVAVSSTGTGNRVMTSPDGISWTSRTSAADNQWQSVVYGNGLFVAVSDNGTGTSKVGSMADRVMTSPDGITWNARTAAADNDWYSITYGTVNGSGLFVAVSYDSSGDINDRVMTSPDGITWIKRTAAENHKWHSVTYGTVNGTGLFVAVSTTNSDNRVMISSDGINWTKCEQIF